MKTIKFLFLILFLTAPSLSEVLLLFVNEGKLGSAHCLECAVRPRDVCIPVNDISLRRARSTP